MINGYSGYYPVSYTELWAKLASFPSDESMAQRRDVEPFDPFRESGADVRIFRLRDWREPEAYTGTVERQTP